MPDRVKSVFAASVFITVFLIRTHGEDKKSSINFPFFSAIVLLVRTYGETGSFESSTEKLENEYDQWEETRPINETVLSMDEIPEDSQPQNDYQILYDIYSPQPDMVEEIDEDGLEISDHWIILDAEDEWQMDTNETIKRSSIEHSVRDAYDDSDISRIPDDGIECVDEKPEQKKRKSKNLSKKRKNDEFYFKHKKYGKTSKTSGKTETMKGAAPQKKNWKKNCCIRGKKVGNSRRTFLSPNLFNECQKRTRTLASRMSKSCKWIFWSCCEARALRRYYIQHKPGKNPVC